MRRRCHHTPLVREAEQRRWGGGRGGGPWGCDTALNTGAVRSAVGGGEQESEQASTRWAGAAAARLPEAHPSLFRPLRRCCCRPPTAACARGRNTQRSSSEGSSLKASSGGGGGLEAGSHGGGGALCGSSWVTKEEFYTGLAVSQAMPGPLFNFAAYLGAPVDGGVRIRFLGMHVKTMKPVLVCQPCGCLDWDSLRHE